MRHPLVLYVGNQIKGLINAGGCIQRINTEALKGRWRQHLAHELSEHQDAPTAVCIRPLFLSEDARLNPHLGESITGQYLLQVYEVVGSASQAVRQMRMLPSTALQVKPRRLIFLARTTVGLKLVWVRPALHRRARLRRPSRPELRCLVPGQPQLLGNLFGFGLSFVSRK